MSYVYTYIYVPSLDTCSNVNLGIISISVESCYSKFIKSYLSSTSGIIWLGYGYLVVYKHLIIDTNYKILVNNNNNSYNLDHELKYILMHIHIYIFIYIL